MGNAVKFTEKGGIVLRLSHPDDSLRIICEVEDTGSGIPEDEINRLFQPFEQTVRGKSRTDGTGLGLFISREYARMMGGDITVTSSSGKGSIVSRVETAYKQSLLSETRAGTPERRVAGLEKGQYVPSILVVDDNISGRMLLTGILRKTGYNVMEASNGQEAIDIFNDRHPDIILMDMIMPDLDGIKTTGIIKNTDHGKNIPVIAITANIYDEGLKPAMEAGCSGFISKPFRRDELLTVIASHLGCVCL